MSVLKEIPIRKHEQVSIFQDPATQMLAVIAVHDTTLGPSLGGCRMREYDSVDDALFDALKLSEAMTYKNSLAGLNIGGGKSVIIGNSELIQGKEREKLFLSFGKAVASLDGRYITAEDMGTSVMDMSIILKSTEFVSGRDPLIGGGGDPSPHTAQGCFDGIRACLERLYNSGDYRGRSVAIQGVGHVGVHLAKLLVDAGAKVTISDLNEAQLLSVARELGVQRVAVHEILNVECDIFAPCAVGGTINPQTVDTLRCKAVAGAANNQISDDNTEERLFGRGILYAPDFAINAGGVILCADELEEGGVSFPRVRERVSRIYHTVCRVLDESKTTGELPGKVAVRLAKERIDRLKKAQLVN